MRFLLPVLLLSLTLPLDAATSRAPTVFSALKKVPKPDASRVARIVAFEGVPEPERWHFLVHDPEAAGGLREHVVADGELVASREVSQFAETVAESDIVNRSSLRIDSDRLGRIANEYALVNRKPVTSMNYSLANGGEGEAPVWRVDCVGSDGEVLGTVEIAADTGKVIETDGFAFAPAKSSTSSKRGSKAEPELERLQTEAMPQVAVLSETVGEDSDARDGEAEVAEDGDGANGERVSGSSSGSREPSRARSRSSRRSRPDVIGTARTVTRPVRRVVRRILPF